MNSEKEGVVLRAVIYALPLVLLFWGLVIFGAVVLA